MEHIHFIGIGGYSMSGIAKVLHEMGYTVSGSDAKPSRRTERLVALGVPVAYTHEEANLKDADLVVYTTDVHDDNPEFQAAKARSIPVLHRSQMLAKLLNKGRGVAVTGTHGKTTTATLVAHLFDRCGLDPTVLLGGELDAFGGSAKLGKSDWVVAEADESDGSFLNYDPEVAIITNIEPEHLEYYGGEFNNMLAAFGRFAERVRKGGLLVVCYEDAHALGLARVEGVRTMTYGMTNKADLWATDVEPAPPSGHRFTVMSQDGEFGRFELPIPGRHNVLNALAAIAAARYAGIGAEAIGEALHTFCNAHRRFEIHFDGAGLRVVDDYAHHPTEIRAVLSAARELRPGRLIAVFQPQRYTRTKNHFQAFVESFDDADLVVITKIFSPPGEKPIPGISGERLAECIRERKGGHVLYAESPEDVVREVEGLLKEGDLLLTMGAGDIFRAAEHLAKGLRAS